MTNVQSRFQADRVFGNPQRKCKKIHVPTVQQVVQYKKQFEDTHSHSHWGETAQVHNVRLCSKKSSPPENAHFETHWRKPTPLCPV